MKPSYLCPDCGREKSPGAARCLPCYKLRRARSAMRPRGAHCAVAVDPLDEHPELLFAFLPHPPPGWRSR